MPILINTWSQFETETQMSSESLDVDAKSKNNDSILSHNLAAVNLADPDNPSKSDPSSLHQQHLDAEAVIFDNESEDAIISTPEYDKNDSYKTDITDIDTPKASTFRAVLLSHIDPVSTHNNPWFWISTE